MNRLLSSSGSLPAAAVPSVTSVFQPIVRSMSAFKHVSHVIFDMDGLLLDTEPLYSELFQKVIDPYGKVYTWEVKMKLMGRQSEETARTMVSEYDLPMTWQEFAEQVKALGQSVMSSAQLMPGAERLIRHLHATKVPFALATSSSQEMAELKMTNHQELFSLFHHKVYGTTDPEVIVGKPAPDIFLVAGRRFPDKPDPSKCLVFEDAPNGVRAATLAGMQSVMVPDEHVAEELRTEATLVLKNLNQFKPESFGLPAFVDSASEKNGH